MQASVLKAPPLASHVQPPFTLSSCRSLSPAIFIPAIAAPPSLTFLAHAAVSTSSTNVLNNSVTPAFVSPVDITRTLPLQPALPIQPACLTCCTHSHCH